jgi:hypothetical protein
LESSHYIFGAKGNLESTFFVLLCLGFFFGSVIKSFTFYKLAIELELGIYFFLSLAWLIEVFSLTNSLLELLYLSISDVRCATNPLNDLDPSSFLMGLTRDLLALKLELCIYEA